MSALSIAVLQDVELAGAVRLNDWAKARGVSRTTAWRLRKKGVLNVITRYGVHFVTGVRTSPLLGG